MGIAALCVAQFTLSMTRYTANNLCQFQAHTLATSCFEQILYQRHPLELMARHSVPDGVELGLLTLNHPSADGDQTSLTYNREDGFDTTHPFFASVLAPNDLRVELDLQVRNNPLYGEDAAGIEARTHLPEGFQSLHLKYRWKLVAEPDDDFKWKTDHLYALRPIDPNDPI
jgi:hypothetical protein